MVAFGEYDNHAIVETIEKHQTIIREFLKLAAYKEIACLEIE